MQQVNCPHCRVSLGASDINIDTGLARCHGCNSVFYLKAPEPAPVTKIKLDYDNSWKNVEMPKGMTAETNGMELVLTRRSFKPSGLFFLFFSGFWNLVVLTFIVAMFSSGEIEIFFVLFLIPFILVGLGTAYGAIFSLFNKMVVTVSSGIMKIRFRPLPGPGQKDLRTADILQLYVKEGLPVSGRGIPVSLNSYDLYMLTKQGARIQLLSFPKVEMALFFERSIEQFLGIKDEAVPGELR